MPSFKLWFSLHSLGKRLCQIKVLENILGHCNTMFNTFNNENMIKPEWHFMNKPMTRKKLIQKLQQLIDKLPKGKERKSIRKRLLNLKLNKNQK